MGFTIGTILTGGIAGGGIANVVSALMNQPEKPEQGQLPTAADAKKIATTDQANQRRLLLAGGGNTDVTGGTGVLTGADVTKSTLLGG